MAPADDNMKIADWPWIRGLQKLLAPLRQEPSRQAERIVSMQLHIVLPAKAGVIAVVLYFLFSSGWFSDEITTYSVALETIRKFFLVYVVFNAAAMLIFTLWRRFPPGIFQWLVFALGILDGLFVADLVFITDGFGSIAFWIFPGLIVLNAMSIPLAMPQIVLNLMLSLFYVIAGILNAQIQTPEVGTLPAGVFHRVETSNAIASAEISKLSRSNYFRIRATDVPYQAGPQMATEPFLPRVFVLWLLTACCYGAQALAARQRQALEEAREFAMREGQLRSAGRLAAEFAHQIKNPLAIMNNTVFSLERALRQGRNDVGRQIQIIREEIDRSDKIITQIMGYAQLSEGHVERLELVPELEAAIDRTIPPAAGYDIRVERRYEPPFPPLLMQRRHLSDIFVNLLQNAREALHEHGRINISARCREDASIEVSLEDSGPGIPPDKIERIFEAYYTTKEKGTGLGLAVVKHNIELYGGSIRAESVLGKGARFILKFPARTVVK